MMELMNRLTDKPDWDKKVFDDDIVSKWRQEALTVNDTGVDISSKMVDWCMAELRYKADVFRQTHCVETLDSVWKSDTLISEELRNALQRAVAPLMDVPEREKDWHPGSNDQVLDLVHPSIYPLVYGQTVILPDGIVGRDECMDYIGKGQRLAAFPPDEPVFYEWSRRFQWLPAEFEVPAGSEEVR
jgi:hypothetical protein